MNSVVLFLCACIPLRLLLAWATTKVPDAYMPLLAMALAAISAGILYLYFSNTRLEAPEGGGHTWWAPYRLIIGLLWLAAAVYAFQGRKDLVWIPLVIDVLFGLVVFGIRHWPQKSI